MPRMGRLALAALWAYAAEAQSPTQAPTFTTWRPTVAGASSPATTPAPSLRPTTPGGTVLVRESVEAQNLKRGRPRTPRSPGGSVLYATPRGTRLLRPLTGGGSERPLTPGGSIEGLPVDVRTSFERLLPPSGGAPRSRRTRSTRPSACATRRSQTQGTRPWRLPWP